VRIGPLIFAALLAGLVAWRWRRTSTENRVIALVAAAALAVYGSGLVHPPNIEKLILDAGAALGPYAYVLVGVMTFLETGAFVGLVAPGEFTIILGGVVAGQGEINVIVLIGLVWACAVLGDTTSFMLGRRLGREFLVKHGARVKITEARLQQVEGYFERHGGKTILIGRFVGLLRALGPFIAGASRMSFRRFLPFDVVGAGLWGAFFCILGYVFWQSFDQVVEVAKRGAFALGTVITLVIGGIVAYRYLRVPANRERVKAWVDEQAERPLLRPVARVVRPVYRHMLRPVWRRAAGPLRFFWERVTPGQLGLELTTLLAVALVGGFVFGALASLVSDHEVFTGDGRAFDLVRDLNSGGLVDAAEVLTRLGSLPVTGLVTAVAVTYLVTRREAVEAGTLVIASVLTFAGVHIAKAAEDRPRPIGGLVGTEGSSFPSGHAAYAVVYVAIAVALARAFPGFVYRAGVVIGALVLAAVVGLTRIYLRAHFLSDVLAGWGLAAAIFAICGMVAMIVAFFRHNPDRP